MNPTFLAYLTTVMTWLQWLVGIGMSAFANAWKTSKQATEVIIVLAVGFAVVVWLGFAPTPKVHADNTDVLRELGVLSAKLDKANCPAAVVTGSVVKPVSKAKK